MNVRKDNSKDWTNVCVMRAFYDETGEYREEYIKDIPLSELPEKAVARIAFDYDLSILYSEHEVLVIATSMQDIDEHRRLEGAPKFFHGLLHIPDTRNYDGYLCIAITLKTLRRQRERAQKRNSSTENSNANNI